MLRTTIVTLAAALFGVGLLLPAAPVAAQDARDCADFASQAEAQAAYRADPTDPAGNDEDGDGLACELYAYTDTTTDLTPVTAATTTTAQATPAAGAATTAGTTTTALPSTGTGATLTDRIADQWGVALGLGLVATILVGGTLARRGERRA